MAKKVRKALRAQLENIRVTVYTGRGIHHEDTLYGMLLHSLMTGEHWETGILSNARMVMTFPRAKE